MSPFIYVIIAAIAVFPMLIAFKIIIDRIKSGQITQEKGQISFFLSVFIIEIIPIILIVYAFSQNATVTGFDELIVPGLLVLVFMGISVFFIFLQNNVGVPRESKQRLMVFSLIGLSLTNAIPIVSIVGLFSMLS